MLESLLLLLAAGGTPQDADGLAPARAGKLQCVKPDAVKKTCLAIASYSFGTDGTVTTTVTQLLNPTPRVTMEVTAVSTIENGALCTVIKAESYANAPLTLDGQPAPQGMVDTTRPQILAAIAPLAMKKACQTQRTDGDHLVIDVVVDGVARPEMSSQMSWVAPADGYQVGI